MSDIENSDIEKNKFFYKGKGCNFFKYKKL